MNIQNLMFRTYGTSKINFRETYDLKRKNRRDLDSRNKPVGLWASPEARGFKTWKTWSIRENYNIYALNKWVDFKLKRDAKILVLASEKDMDFAWSKYPLAHSGKRRFNWQKIEKHYDAVYFDWKSWIRNPRSKYHFSSWDVDSLCVFNLRCIDLVKK